VFDQKQQQHVVLLREADGERILPIWIGPAEALAIQRLLSGQEFPRPLTHDLFALVLEGLHARVSRVTIVEMREGTFFATLVIEREKSVLSVDARPSDSVAIALRTQAPLFANEELLQAPPEQGSETESETPAEEDPPPPPPTDEEKAEQLRRFLEKLNPEDFGKFQM
jgi:bifunctional DNase/RNase